PSSSRPWKVCNAVAQLGKGSCSGLVLSHSVDDRPVRAALRGRPFLNPTRSTEGRPRRAARTGHQNECDELLVSTSTKKPPHLAFLRRTLASSKRACIVAPPRIHH